MAIAKEILERDLSELVPRMFSGRFRYKNICTVEDLINAIQIYGLEELDKTSKGTTYAFFDRQAPFISGAGPKAWSAVLKVLDNLDFNWRDYVVRKNRRQPELMTRMELSKQIEANITELIALLRQYLTLMNGE